MRTRGEVWKLRVPLLTPVSPPTLAALGLQAVWDGLDPARARRRTADGEGVDEEGTG